MRIVHTPDEFAESFLAAQREAAASFGVNTILLEKYITQPRHIEVQVIILILSLILLPFLQEASLAAYFCFEKFKVSHNIVLGLFFSSSELNRNNGIQIVTINTKISICLDMSS